MIAEFPQSYRAEETTAVRDVDGYVLCEMCKLEEEDFARVRARPGRTDMLIHCQIPIITSCVMAELEKLGMWFPDPLRYQAQLTSRSHRPTLPYRPPNSTRRKSNQPSISPSPPDNILIRCCCSGNDCSAIIRVHMQMTVLWIG